MPEQVRLDRYGALSARLAALTDAEVRELLVDGEALGTGIGGATTRVRVAGLPVFVKLVPLTESELRPAHIRSTANLFGLPTRYQYGVGSAGFGAWRELAAHELTTGWVLAGQCSHFPLTYHWRVLPGPRSETAENGDELARTVAYWGGSAAVRDRLEALDRSPASIMLFLEHFPDTLRGWLAARLADGAENASAAATAVERDLLVLLPFLARQGFFHFDAHFENVLTDGRRLYLTDFGLATSTNFDLSVAERRFLASNRTHDACYAVTRLVNALVAGLTGNTDWPARTGFIRRCARGEHFADLPAPIMALIRRYAPIAVIMNDFYSELHGESRSAVYPEEAIARVCGAVGFMPLDRNLRPVVEEDQ